MSCKLMFRVIFLTIRQYVQIITQLYGQQSLAILNCMNYCVFRILVLLYAISLICYLIFRLISKSGVNLIINSFREYSRMINSRLIKELICLLFFVPCQIFRLPIELDMLTSKTWEIIVDYLFLIIIEFIFRFKEMMIIQ